MQMHINKTIHEKINYDYEIYNVRISFETEKSAIFFNLIFDIKKVMRWLEERYCIFLFYLFICSCLLIHISNNIIYFLMSE